MNNMVVEHFNIFFQIIVHETDSIFIISMKYRSIFSFDFIFATCLETSIQKKGRSHALQCRGTHLIIKDCVGKICHLNLYTLFTSAVKEIYPCVLLYCFNYYTPTTNVLAYWP